MKTNPLKALEKQIPASHQSNLIGFLRMPYLVNDLLKKITRVLPLRPDGNIGVLE
jgi:hypothetical protein